MSASYSVSGASEAQNKMLASISESFATTDEYLKEIADEVYSNLCEGLQSGHAPGGLPARVSYITADIINDIRQAARNEQTVLGLTINTSAKYIKVASVAFRKAAGATINKQIFFASRPISKASDFFEAAATDVANFINSHDIVPEHGQPPLSLGMTIDVPLQETNKGEGRVVGCGNSHPTIFEGVDIARGLNAVLIKKHLPVRVTSTTNCAISTLVISRHRLNKTSVALVLNRGINAAYYEDASKIAKLSDTELGKSESRVAINTELAYYGKHSQILRHTQWDNRIDRESDNPGDRIFEKLVADKYLGEIVRNLITDFVDAQLLFSKSADSTVLSSEYSFYTSYMTIMEDSSPDLSDIGDLLASGFNIQSSVVDRRIIRALCHIVTLRAARLVGAASAAVVKKALEALPAKEPALASISGQLTEMNQPYVECVKSTAERLLAGYGVGNAEFYILGEDGYTVGAALTSLGS